jgi:lipid-binding SYLF domain-containing protein
MQMMMRAAAVVVMCVVGCATSPSTPAGRQDLVRNAETTREQMVRRDPSLRSFLDQAAGYVVFPRIGKGGAIVGGAYGQGVLFEQGRATGFVKLEQASLGAQLGGQTFAELLVLGGPRDVRDVKDGDYTMSADASVIALTSGAAASANLADGVTAFVMPLGGLMVDVSVAGQRIQFEPAG